MERELRSGQLTPLHTPYIENNEVVEHFFSSASEFSLDLHCTSVPPYERQPVSASYISQPSSSTLSLSSTYSSYSGTCQPSMSNFPRESAEITCCLDSLQGVLDYSDNVNTVNDRLQSSCVMTSVVGKCTNKARSGRSISGRFLAGRPPSGRLPEANLSVADSWRADLQAADSQRPIH